MVTYEAKEEEMVTYVEYYWYPDLKPPKTD